MPERRSGPAPRGARRVAGALAALATALAGPAALPAGAQSPVPSTAPAAVPSAAPYPGPSGPAGAPRVLDDFRDPSRWQASASEGVQAAAVPVAGGALALRYDFGGSAGYAVLQRELPLDWPDHFELRLTLRGSGPRNHLEVKFVDDSGDNVWWHVQRDVAWPAAPTVLRIKRRQVSFAWGPAADRTLRQTRTLQLVVTAGRGGGRGELVFSRLELVPLPAPGPVPAPVARATSALPDAPADAAVDGRDDTGWRSDPAAGREQALTMDLGVAREFGGLVIDWLPGLHARRLDVQLSDDGRRWTTTRRVVDGGPASLPLMLTEREARYVRLQLHEGPAAQYGIREVRVQPLAFGADANAFVSALAARAPRGRYPRGFHGEQAWWTVAGVDGARDSLLMGEDGAVELGIGLPSVEPFVADADGVHDWAGTPHAQALAGQALPIPSVRWDGGRWTLEVTAFATGRPGRVQGVLRYRVANRTEAPLALTLLLAVRPFQVNPPTQFLNTTGGFSPIGHLEWDGTRLAIDHAPRVHPLQAPAAVVLSPFDRQDDPATWATLPAGTGPTQLQDLAQGGTAVLRYPVSLQPGAMAEVALVTPVQGLPVLPAGPRAAPGTPAARAAERWTADQAAAAAQAWQRALGDVTLQVPAADRAVTDTLRTALAHLLLLRDGPMLRPGTRSYARAWIRDGAMMSASLLRLGRADVAREFLDGFAPYQFANGKVPCCVDRRGADPVTENDSHGQLIHLVHQVWQLTGDRTVLQRHWPRVRAAVAHMDALRAQTRAAAVDDPARRPFAGLLPASISHEGYAEKPMHALWDDFWGLRGYDDAVEIAQALGERDAAARIATSRDGFRRDVHAAIRATAAARGITWVPGAIDLGDFDATSTTIALAPGHEQALLPPALLEGTFARYWHEFVARRDGQRDWKDYTPYELRNVGAFIRLGWRERADEAVRFFLADRRPPAWNQWPEVIRRGPREPGFIGDLPHGWVASDYLAATLDRFAYERPSDRALVLAAGVPPRWLEDGGVLVRGLHTPYGRLGYRLQRDGREAVLQVDRLATLPPGGVVVQPPRRDDTCAPPAPELRLPALPATLRWRCDPPSPERAP